MRPFSETMFMQDREKLLTSFTTSIQPARRAWVVAATTVLSQYDLSMSLGSVVLLLHRYGGTAQQKILATEVGINAAAMVRVLDQGEAAGLLLRAGLQDNRRSKTVSLSEPGRALAKRVEKAIQALRAELLQNVSPGDIDTAVRVLRQLEANALAYCAEEKART